jgi:hypothetical protein
MLLLLILMLPLVVGGQNLVPNGSFEQLDSCPVGASCTEHLEFATNWFEPIRCGVDLYHGCVSQIGCGVPQGSVYPVDGNGMVAIGMLAVGGFSNEAREYASTILIEPLIEDSIYRFEMRLRLAGSDALPIGSVGAYFSLDSATNYSLDHQLVGLTPQLQRDPDSLMTDMAIWYLWDDTLVAEGGEQFLMIGNFLDDANTPYLQFSVNTASVYYIDDVRLTKITKPNSVKELDVRFGVSPNPSNGLVSIEYKSNLTPRVVTLLTIEGRQVFSQPWQRQLDVSGFSEGVYLLQVEFDNGAVGTQRLVIQH